MKKTLVFAMAILWLCAGVALAAQKTMTAYMLAGDIVYPIELNTGDFVFSGTSGAITGSLATNDLSMGNNLNDSSGSYWYGGDSDAAYCLDGKCNFGVGVRVYFDFIFRTPDTSSDSTAQADGFMFSIANGSNNNKLSTGGAPAGITMGELMGYAGPGTKDGNGLRPPKFGIEFDTFPNNGSSNICAGSSRNDDDDNHMALMFWGQDSAALTGNCNISGTNYPKHLFDDNRHAEGTGNNPTNSYHGDGSGGYYSVAKGSNTYNWLEDNQWHSYRMEVIRNLAPESSGTNSGKYAYNIKAWVDCPSCTAQQLAAFQNLPIAFDAKTPQINRTVYLTATQHSAFSTMLFGFSVATGSKTEVIGIQNFNVYFPRSECNYGISPVSVNYSNAAQTGKQVILYTGSTCSWNIVNSNSWITITSGTSGTGNATVTYNVAANSCQNRTGSMTIADQIFTVNQEASATPLSITTPSLPNPGRVGVAYSSTTVTATGGSLPYTWSQVGLPTGLSLASSTGIISGTPNAVGLYSPQILVTDSCPQTATASYSVRIKPNTYTIRNSTGATIYRQSGGICTFANRITNNNTYPIAYDASAVTFYSNRNSSNVCSGNNISITGAQADAADTDYNGAVQITNSWTLTNY